MVIITNEFASMTGFVGTVYPGSYYLIIFAFIAKENRLYHGEELLNDHFVVSGSQPPN